MSKVYFKSIKDFNNKELINETITEMLNKLESDGYSFTGTIPLKVHFGERGNETFITPDNFKSVRDFLTYRNVKSYYMDTNVLYKGSRTETDEHIKTAKEHGFTDLDIIIADDGHSFDNIEVGLKNFDSCMIGARYKEFSKFIVLSHFKGHGLAGFGGAVKQLGMGFASRGGKMAQHSSSVPIIDESKCISCGKCASICPANAINVEDYAVIDSNKCIGCASCTVACPVNAITNSWTASNFHEKLAEYAYAASRNKDNIYITYAFNITKECDCNGSLMKPIADNIGMFASTDPVAIDRAVYDMFKASNSTNAFDTALITLDYAEEIGLGSNKYEIEEI